MGKGLIVIVEGVKYSETSFVHSPYIPSILVRLPLPLYRIRRRENRHLFHVFVRAARRLSIVAAVPRWADLGGIGVRVCFGDGFVTENVDHLH